MQGVFFRDATRARADELGVAGWVRNRSDGAVEAVFEGEVEAVEAALAFVREGPDDAQVDGVEVEDVEVEGRHGFRVR